MPKTHFKRPKTIYTEIEFWHVNAKFEKLCGGKAFFGCCIFPGTFSDSRKICGDFLNFFINFYMDCSIFVLRLPWMQHLYVSFFYSTFAFGTSFQRHVSNTHCSFETNNTSARYFQEKKTCLFICHRSCQNIQRIVLCLSEIELYIRFLWMKHQGDWKIIV